MNKIFIDEIKINKVRNLKNTSVNITKHDNKHLVITGKNGSGKTSLLDAIATYLNDLTIDNHIIYANKEMQRLTKTMESYKKIAQSSPYMSNYENQISKCKDKIDKYGAGLILKFNVSEENIRTSFENGEFIVAYYKANRTFSAIESRTVEKVDLENYYPIEMSPSKQIIKYLLDMKMTQALASSSGKIDKVKVIQNWFDSFENLLRKIFNNQKLNLVFDEETFLFHITEPNKQPYDFNTLSSGYAAVINIIIDLMMRMEKYNNKSFLYELSGIVLVDEIETHLHLEMQKEVLRLLTTIFPNIQFIVSTHSPFILNSVEGLTIYDTEKNMVISDSLTNLSYGGLVEGYFKSDALSIDLRQKLTEYKKLVTKETLSDDDFEHIAKLALYLDEIPNFLEPKFSMEYRNYKEVFEHREDI